MSKQNLKDRFHGINDPLAKKHLAVAEEKLVLAAPEDKSICTLYLGLHNFTLDGSSSDPNDVCTEKDIRNAFYTHGDVKTVKILKKHSCAFLTFTTRAAAESATAALYRNLKIKGKVVKIKWAKKAGNDSGASSSSSSSSSSSAAAEAPKD